MRATPLSAPLKKVRVEYVLSLCVNTMISLFSFALYLGAVTSAEPKVRGSLDRKSASGRVQFSTLAASVAGRESLSRSTDSANGASSKGASGVGSTSYSRGLAPLTSPQKAEEPSKLLQSERAK